jgi:hypothetical protein
VVNKSALKQLYAIGEITMKELKGCYSTKVVKSIQVKVKVKEKNGDSD